MKRFCLKTEKRRLFEKSSVLSFKRNINVSCNEKIKTNY